MMMELFAQVAPVTVPEGWTGVFQVIIAVTTAIGVIMSAISVMLTTVVNAKSNAALKKADVGAEKTDRVEKMLNSELAKFKAEAKAASDKAMADGIAQVQSLADSRAVTVANEYKVRIAKLEADLSKQSDQLLMTLAKTQPLGPAPADIIVMPPGTHTPTVGD